MGLFWLILLRVLWVVLVVIVGFLTLLMFAFADSPGAGKAAQRMIGPIFVTAFLVFGASAWLLMQETWWSIPSAFVLTITPPFLVFLGYNVLMK